ncbi:hypothetical protein C8J56DRAFT_256370 [Mycena floridula]|nr:hypothetical protein C8J56DRAFT_256370 [Mycena floridula]
MKTTLALLKLFSVWTLLTLPYVVEADITSNATCLSSFKWASNACGQNPCLVAAHLQSTCVSGSYSLAALGPNSHYIGPARDQANPCQCSSVVYSLMSACAACQGQNYDSWNEWNVNCQTVYLAVYPKEIPINTSVPQWAYVSLEVPVSLTSLFQIY